MDFADIDGVAGLAALINGLILWPLVHSLKKDHGRRLTTLEAKRTARTKRSRRTKRCS